MNSAVGIPVLIQTIHTERCCYVRGAPVADLETCMLTAVSLCSDHILNE